MSKGLAASGVLLVSVGVSDKGPILQVIRGTLGGGGCWTVALLKVVSRRQKGLLRPWSVAGESAYSLGRQRK